MPKYIYTAGNVSIRLGIIAECKKIELMRILNSGIATGSDDSLICLILAISQPFQA